MKICALVYNNCSETAAESIRSVLQQTYKEFDLFVCGNNNDELKACFNEDGICWIDSSAERNVTLGKCFNIIVEQQYDWVWYLDSNLVADTSALQQFVNSLPVVDKAGYLVSVIKQNDQVVCIPKINSNVTENGIPKWAERAYAGLIRVSSAYFESVLINTKAIQKIGRPTEQQLNNMSDYLAKISGNFGAGYYATNSRCYANNLQKNPTNASTKLKICAVIVTYNRKHLLSECLDALKKQTYNEFDVLIIDNASTDGTFRSINRFINNRIQYYNTGANLGGAGGFYYGMKLAYEKGYDWIWIMDDDVIPSPTALEELVAPAKEIKNVSFFASAVYSPKGEAMNTPEISKFSTNGYRFWYSYLDKGLVRLAHATFVSLLINRYAIAKCGLPCRDYFIWGDDTEYTMRIIGKYGAAYMVGKSKVVHKRETASTLSIRKESNPNRIKMYYYMIRNTLLNAKTYFGKRSLKNFKKTYIKDAVKIAIGKRGYRLLKVKTILRALNDFENKRYNVNAFENRYAVYGQEKLVATITKKDYVSSSPFHTVRSISSSLFGYNTYVDSYVASFIKPNNHYSCGIGIERLRLLDKNEKLILDTDSIIKPFITVRHGDQTYYFDDDVEFDDRILSDGNITIARVDPYSLDAKLLKDRVYQYLENVLKQYQQTNIIIVKPSDARNNILFEYLCDKMPAANTIDSLNELFEEE